MIDNVQNFKKELERILIYEYYILKNEMKNLISECEIDELLATYPLILFFDNPKTWADAISRYKYFNKK